MSETQPTELTGRSHSSLSSAERLLADAGALIAGGWCQRALARGR
jgi:hypothetical protein